MATCVVARRSDGEGNRASRRNKKAQDFTDPFIHKSTLLSIPSDIIGKDGLSRIRQSLHYDARLELLELAGSLGVLTLRLST